MSYRLTYLVTLAFACGSSNNTKTVDAPPLDAATPDALTAAEACAQSAQLRCTELMTCSPADLEKRFGDLTTCETREALTCTNALAAPGTANSPAAVAACSVSIGSESCAEFLSDKQIPDPCVTQLGSGSNGTACQFAAQCATGFCALASQSVCGTCAPQPAAGDQCVTQGCGQSLICVPDTQTCQAPEEAGSACNIDFPCDGELTCVGSDVGSNGSGTCTPELGSAGDACDHTHATLPECDTDLGLFCDTDTNECVTQPIVGAGSACGDIAGSDNVCSAAATCEATGSGSDKTSTCIAPAGDGSACDPSVGLNCLTPAKCVATGSGTAGTCTFPGSATCP